MIFILNLITFCSSFLIILKQLKRNKNFIFLKYLSFSSFNDPAGKYNIKLFHSMKDFCRYLLCFIYFRLGDFTVNDILEIHKRVMGFVDPVESGVFRRTQVFVGGHIPPGPLNIPPLMEQFASWLNSEAAQRMHPVQYAALAHYKLVHIHPFSDGNGRTSRLLMNMILMQAGFPPVIVLKQDRQR